MTAWIAVSDCQEALAAKDARIAELEAALREIAEDDFSGGAIELADHALWRRVVASAALDGREWQPFAEWSNRQAKAIITVQRPDTEGER